MATKLRRLMINEGSLVDEPANKLARVVLFKRAHEPAQNPPPTQVARGERSEPMSKQDDNWLSRMVRLIAKKVGLTDEDVAKMETQEPKTVDQVLAHDKAMNEFWSLRWALSSSLESIMESDKGMDEKVQLMTAAVQQFAEKAKDLMPTLQEGEDIEKVQAFLQDVTGAGTDVAKIHQVVKAMEPPSKPPGDTSLVNPQVKKKECESMTFEDYLKSLSPEDRVKVETDLTKRYTPAKFELPEDVKKQLEAATQAAAKVEALEKRAGDAEIKVAKAEKDLADERERRVSREYLEKAAKYPSQGEQAAVAAMLRKAFEVSEEFGKQLEDTFTKAEAAIAKSVLFQELGKAGRPTEGSAEDRIEKLAQERVAKGTAKSYEQAYDDVLKQNPELYEQSRAEGGK